MEETNVHKFRDIESDEKINFYLSPEYQQHFASLNYPGISSKSEIMKALYSLEWYYLDRSRIQELITQHPDLTVKDYFTYLSAYNTF